MATAPVQCRACVLNLIRKCYSRRWWFRLVREPLVAGMRWLAWVNGVRPGDYAATNPECRGCLRFVKAELEKRSAVFRVLNGLIGPRFRALRDVGLTEADFDEAKQYAGEMMRRLEETEGRPPAGFDVVMDDPAELAIPPDLRPEEDEREDFFPEARRDLRPWLQTALAALSLPLHAAVILLVFFYVSRPEIPLAGSQGDQDLEIAMVTLRGGGAELEETPPEPELEEETPPEPEPEPLPPPPEPQPEPEALKVQEETPPPPPPPKAKPQRRPPKKVSADPTVPPGPGVPDGESTTGGGGAGLKGGESTWKAVSVPTPPYPEASISNREEGRVVLRVEVLPSGQVGGVSLLQSSGYPRLDASATTAARRIRFKLSGPQPSHTVTVRVPYRFNLRDRY